MPKTDVSRIFRVFVSSTFSDFAAEREVLRTRVLQPMAELLLARGFLLQVIDLRWGITTEAALGNQAVQICLDQVRLCQERSPRPNFVVLAGDRYGWCPAPAQLPEGDLEALVRAAPPAAADRLRGAYARDANAVPPVHVLRRRRDGRADAAWAAAEPALARTVAEALARVGPEVIPADRRAAYLKSATEREIDVGLFDAADPERHVLAVLRTVRGLGEAMAGPGAARLARYVDLREDGRWDEVAWGREQALRGRIARRLAPTGRVFSCDCSAGDDGLSTAHLGAEATLLRPEEAVERPARTLAEAVWRGLWQVLLPEVEVRLAARRARLLHAGLESAELGRDRARRCVGRDDLLAALVATLEAGGGEPLLLHGPSGVGKSTALAALCDRLRRAHGDWSVVERYVGAGGLADDTVALLDGLTAEIDPRAAGQRAAGDPIAASASAFLRALRAPRAAPLVVVIDALDQLPLVEQERLADWLPARLPPGVRLVVSTTRDPSELPAALAASPRQVALRGLDRAGGEALLDEHLAEAHRTLTPGQRAEVLQVFEVSHLPLWMDLAARQARRWTPGDAPGLPAAPEALIDGWFQALALEHGDALVSHVLGFLAASRRGLTETALWDLCGGVPAIHRQLLGTLHHVPEESRALAPAAAPGDGEGWLTRVQRDGAALDAWAERLVAAGVALPQAVWIRLREDLAIYLAERDADGMTLVDFHHALVRRVARARTPATGVHRRMAACFADRWRRGDLLALDEVAAQLAASQQPAELAGLLTDPHWQVLALRHLGVGRLEAAFAVGADAGLDEAARAELAAILDAITESAHAVTGRRGADRVGADADLLPGQLLGRLQGRRGPLVERFLQRLAAWRPALERDWADRDLLLPVTPSLPATSSRLVRTIAGHDRAAWYGPPPPLSSHVALAVDGRTGVSCDDWRILAWDVRTGVERQRIDVVTGDERWGLTGLALAPGGDEVLCTASDGALRRYDLATGSPTGAWAGDVERCAASARARALVTTTRERVVQLRRWETPGAFDVLFRSGEAITALALDAFAPVLALGFADGGLAVWDLEARVPVGAGKTDRAVTALAVDVARRRVWWGDASGGVGGWAYERSAPAAWPTRHRAEVAGLAPLSQDRVVSVSHDTSVRLWRGDTGTPLDWAADRTDPIGDVAPGHTYRVRGVAAHRERAIFATISDDTTVRVWDADPPAADTPRPGHRSAAFAAAIDPQRRCALTASRDGAIARWSLDDGHFLGVLGEHAGEGGMTWTPGDPEKVFFDCQHLAITPDGQHAVSAGAGSVRWWRLEPPFACDRRMPTPELGVREVLWAHDGRMLLGSGSGRLYVAAGDGWRRVGGSDHPFFRPACARRGGFLAWVPVGSRAVAVGRLVGERLDVVGFVEHQADAIAAAFLPDASALLTVGHDRCIRCWAIPSLQPLGVIGRHERPIWDVAVSDDGATAVTVGDDRWVAVWDIARRSLRCCFRSEGAMLRVAIDGAARFVVTGDEAGRPIVLRRIGRDEG
jgi:WD40 repeat protein